jgi:hypothetical protein
MAGTKLGGGTQRTLPFADLDLNVAAPSTHTKREPSHWTVEPDASLSGHVNNLIEIFQKIPGNCLEGVRPPNWLDYSMESDGNTNEDQRKVKKSWQKFKLVCSGFYSRNELPNGKHLRKSAQSLKDSLKSFAETQKPVSREARGWITSLQHAAYKAEQLLPLIGWLKRGEIDQFVSAACKLACQALVTRPQRLTALDTWQGSLLTDELVLPVLNCTMNDEISSRVLSVLKTRCGKSRQYSPFLQSNTPNTYQFLLQNRQPPTETEKDFEAHLLQARQTLLPTTPKEIKLLQELANLAPTDQAVIRVNTILQAKILAARFQTAGFKATWWAKADRLSTPNLNEFCLSNKNIIFVTSKPDLQNHPVKLVVNWSPQINQSDEDSVASIPSSPGGIYAVLAYKSDNGDIDESWKLSQT